MLPGGVYNACWGDVQKLFFSGLGRAGVTALILRSWMQTFSATPRVQISALLLTEMLGVLLRVRRPSNYPPHWHASEAGQILMLVPPSRARAD